MIHTSIILSVYKNLPALGLIFKSLSSQSLQEGFEVIVAEDNNSEETKSFVEQLKRAYSFPVLHVSQADIGFRKCRILNEAIRVSHGTYLIFMDGDCFCHKHFLKEHFQAKKPGFVVYGRRVMLSEIFTNRLIKEQDLSLIHLVNLIRYKCDRLDSAMYLPFTKPQNKKGFWGHNWGIYKSDILLVKGFDEKYEQAGIGEDTDIEWRLEQRGIQFIKLKNKLIQYHLWHKENYSDTKKVEGLLETKKTKYAETHNSHWLMGDL